MTERLIKIFLSSVVGLYVAMVCFNNITDYDSNFQFVRMVANMEDTFSFQTNSWRSVQNPVIHHILYITIIAWELVIAVFIFMGAWRMATKLYSSNIDFKKSKTMTSIGLSLGVMLWFLVFIAIGGEWFLMWQSSKWNAQHNAFFLTCCFLLFLIYHQQEAN